MEIYQVEGSRDKEEGEDFQKGQKSTECGKEVRRKRTGLVEKY